MPPRDSAGKLRATYMIIEAFSLAPHFWFRGFEPSSGRSFSVWMPDDAAATLLANLEQTALDDAAGEDNSVLTGETGTDGRASADAGVDDNSSAADTASVQSRATAEPSDGKAPDPTFPAGSDDLGNALDGDAAATAKSGAVDAAEGATQAANTAADPDSPRRPLGRAGRDLLISMYVDMLVLACHYDGSDPRLQITLGGGDDGGAPGADDDRESAL